MHARPQRDAARARAMRSLGSGLAFTSSGRASLAVRSMRDERQT